LITTSDEMTRPRVAIQLISTGGIYGAERVLLELAGYAHDQGWHSHVVALEGRGAGDLANLATAKGLQAEAFVATGRLAFLPMAARLRQLLRRYPRAIVHSHNYKPDTLLALLRTPTRLACLATCHSSYRDSRKLRVLGALDKRALRRFDRVVGVSGEILRELVESGVPREKVALIHNGIAAPSATADARVKIRAEFGVPDSARLIVQIGRLVQLKRNDLLLDALSKLAAAPDAHVLLVGEGDQRQALIDLALRRGVAQRVHFCGYRADIGEILAAADVLAMTSDFEGMPIVILEAMAMRCPIVSTSVGAVPDVLRDGQDAWLVPTNDVAGLTHALGEALGHPEVARARAARAYSNFLSHHSLESMGARYLEIYERAWAIRGWA
jgi:glycosyltransferase involved in cell wall biosynthesis